MKKLCFVYPTDGDMLTDAAGRLAPDGTLFIQIAVEAQTQPVICGIAAEKDANGLWTAEYALERRENGEYLLQAQTEAETAAIKVYRLNNAAGKYALSVDDNIWWLAELERDRPASIFDHPYLAIYKRAHEEYGAKVRLNLFYQIEGESLELYGPFNLSMMTDIYKSEFEANSHWLHLAFHSLQEHPDEPYKHSTYEEVYEDCLKVRNEIIRFAGAKTYEWATTVHYGECSPQGIQALQQLHIQALMGYMELDGNGNPYVSYNITPSKIREIQRYGFWKDPETGMIYGKIDVVMNLHSPGEITEILTEEHKRHPLRGFVEIMIHEQYFHSFHRGYEPDYADRILAGCRWCYENGYQGVFVEDALQLNRPF